MSPKPTGIQTASRVLLLTNEEYKLLVQIAGEPLLEQSHNVVAHALLVQLLAARRVVDGALEERGGNDGNQESGRRRSDTEGDEGEEAGGIRRLLIPRGDDASKR